MTEVMDELAGVAPAKGNSSLLDGLRKSRRDTLEDTTKKFEIPGYQGDLFAEYRILEPKELERLGKKVMREFKKSRADVVLYGAIDSLAAACECIYVRNEVGELQPLHEIRGEEFPVVFDDRLAETLGFESNGTARSVVYDAFCQRDMAIIKQNIDLSNWLSGIEAPLGEEEPGEL